METAIKKEKGHIATACKALEKQITKNQSEAERHLSKSKEHTDTAQFYLDQNEVLYQQIKTLKGE